MNQKEMKAVYHYDPLTGVFTFKQTRGGRKAGSKAGSIGSDGYWRLSLNKKKVAMHRAIFLYMTGSLPTASVDHINHDILDNRWCNLRAATNTQNQRNRTRNKNNVSGVTGVTPSGNSWIAQVKVSGVTTYLGQHKEWWDAVCARKSADYRYNFHPNHGNQ